MENAKRSELENIDQKNAKRSKYRFGVENLGLKNRGTRVLETRDVIFSHYFAKITTNEIVKN